jgi:uridine kinase
VSTGSTPATTPTAARVAAAVLAAALPDTAPGGPRVVAVDGPSGAGKTSFAGELAQAFEAAGSPAVVVHLDDLYPGWDGLEAVVPLLVRHLLAPLAAGAPVTLPTWDWAAGAPGPERAVAALGPPAPPVVVVEGAGSGARACRPYLTAVVWLDAPEPVRRARALARDGSTYEPHWDRWARQERAHFARERTAEKADVVVGAPH